MPRSVRNPELESLRSEVQFLRNLIERTLPLALGRSLPPNTALVGVVQKKKGGWTPGRPRKKKGEKPADFKVRMDAWQAKQSE